MIFQRQKILLALARACGGSVSRLQLVKLGFVLAHETSSQGGDTFYNFVPYKFGPYSFTLVRDVDILATLGLVTAPDEHTWALTPAGTATAATVTGAVAGDVQAIGRRWKDCRVSDLVDHVYTRHPWFTVNAQRVDRRREQRPSGQIAVHTIGYEGLSLEGLLDLLLRAGIQRLIDVRANPVSRRFGFHKSTLARHCGHVAIEYVHVPELGIPSEARSELQGDADRARLFDGYRDTTLKSGQGAVTRVANMMTEGPTALLCQESDPSRCHRAHLARAVATQAMLPVVDLGWPR